jgi:hypothetical protein
VEDRLIRGLSLLAIVLIVMVVLCQVARRDSIAELVADLGSDSIEQRQSSFFEILQLGPETKPHLLAAMQSENALVRYNCARLLVRLPPKEQEAISKLKRSLLDTDERVRFWTAVAIANAGCSSVPASNVLVAATEDHELCCQALYSLGDLGVVTDEVLLALVRALQDDDPSKRQAAAVSIGDLGSAANGCLPALRMAADDEDWDVRVAAREALWALTKPSLK